MRKRCAPLGWPQRDPQRYRFAVPNEVWEYKLKPTEFVILSFLCYWYAHGREGKVISVKVAADSLHLTAATVEKHLAILVSMGLVTVNGTPTLKCDDGKFFTLPNEVFLLTLPPSAFLVYAYLLYCEERCTHQCHPSYRTIAGATGLSLNTVVKSVGILTDKTRIEQIFNELKSSLECNDARLRCLLDIERKLREELAEENFAARFALGWEIRKELQGAGILSAHGGEDSGIFIPERSIPVIRKRRQWYTAGRNPDTGKPIYKNGLPAPPG